MATEQQRRAAVDAFYEAYEEADNAFGAMFAAMRAAGEDPAESTMTMKLRRVSEDLGNIRDSVENYGLGEGGEDD
jgi:hypothetical protein